MLKRFLLTSKNKLKSAYQWNASATLLNAFQTVFILLLISRMDPVNDAGVFTIAFAIANLMLTIGKYGIRQFQVSDVDEKYSFREYRASRVITCIAMMIASVIYIAVCFLAGSYNVSKCIVVALVCVTKMIDAFEDVYHGNLQQHMHLDIAGKILTIRLAVYIVVYMVVYFATGNLIIASGASLLVMLVLFLALNRMAWEEIDSKPDSIDGTQVKQLIKECFPLFISSFLVVYIGNAPKYAIDAVMSSEAQACFNYIFMPVFVISLLNQTLYQPMIGKLAILWHDQNIGAFKKMIFRQLLIIVMLSLAVVVGGHYLGIPVLSIIYGVNLKAYRSSLTILLMGGSSLAIVNFLQMIITVIRKQKRLIIGYLVAAILFLVFGNRIVSAYGIIGISVYYSVVVTIIGIVFAGIIIGSVHQSQRH